MKFVSDPPVEVKIRKMKQRVRWQAPQITDRAIDQTRLVIDDGYTDAQFSFLVIGDTGSGAHPDHHPQRRIAERMLEHLDESRFLLHTGDVIYQVGSSEYYPKNFISPYREWLVGGETPQNLTFDRLVFAKPFLPVPGNHDYYDLPLVSGLLAQVTWPVRHLFKTNLNLGVGWHGSEQGQAYARAFLDYLQKFESKNELAAYLDRYYTATTQTGRCLLYQPGRFTRLPNRYYTFRYGGIDFFALDTNTFNAPEALPSTQEGEALRQQLKARQKSLEQDKEKILESLMQLNSDNPEEAEIIDDRQAKLNQIEETLLDIEKQLDPQAKHPVDIEQLEWFKNRLIESWKTEEVRGRIVFFHHPPYVTEATKWEQGQTLEVRHRLRQVFDRVFEEVDDLVQNRPLVDLMLSGHAHCLEYLQTVDTGHADANINWIVCGGSGHSLRRQRAGSEPDTIMENFETEKGEELRKVARSLLFVGRNGRGKEKRRPYSFLRIDVHSGCPPRMVVRPYVTERYQREWIDKDLEPFTIGKGE